MATAALMACSPRLPVGRVEAHLDAMPPITIAGHPVMLHAWLDDPASVVHCPTITWTWPNGTRSSHTEDCDPTDFVTRHSEVKKIDRIPAGDQEFRVDFEASGRDWAANVTVRVPTQ